MARSRRRSKPLNCCEIRPKLAQQPGA
jgi:hypothetical protein